MSKQVMRIANSLHSLNSSPKTKARENLRMLVKATVFLLDQSVIGVKDLDTCSKSVPHISNPLAKVKP